MRLLALLLLAGCTTLPPEALPLAHNPSEQYTREIQDPAPSHAAAGPRFVARAYDPARAKAFEALAEDDYERVMADTGLFSFKPAGLYPVVLYRDGGEYLSKSGAPPWSGGVAVGNAIYTFDGPRMARTLAHEITHLVFHEYMGPRPGLTWFNEGLAVYEELRAAPAADRPELEAWLAQAFPTLCDGLGSLEKRWRLTRD